MPHVTPRRLLVHCLTDGMTKHLESKSEHCKYVYGSCRISFKKCVCTYPNSNPKVRCTWPEKCFKFGCRCIHATNYIPCKFSHDNCMIASRIWKSDDCLKGNRQMSTSMQVDQEMVSKECKGIKLKKYLFLTSNITISNRLDFEDTSSFSYCIKRSIHRF